MASTIKVDKIEGSTGSTITVPTGQTFTVTDGIGVAGGGTGLTSFTAGDVLYATGSTTLAKLAKGTAEQVLAMNSGASAPDWGSVDLTVLPTITVAKGGTALESFTAGDILYATGATTLAKLAKGSADDVLTMNSGATAPEWASGGSSGKVGQVVTIFEGDTQSTTSATFVDTTLTLSITPAATSSKVWITVDGNFGAQANYSCQFRLVRDSTAICISTDSGIGSSQPEATWQVKVASQSAIYTRGMNFVDSPNTTSATTYKLQWRETEGTTLYMNRAWSTSDSSSYPWCASNLTVMEVLA